MKKYLMTGIAALALCVGFTSCSHDIETYTEEDLQDLNVQKVLKTYENAFKATFGTPAANKDWGFTATRTRGAYPNANQWADDGYKAPTELSEGQKIRVMAYFQANPYLTYVDPEFENFFVQQVYKGYTTPGAISPEVYQPTDTNNDPVVGSDHMDHLTFGIKSDGTAKDHDFNFNHGRYSDENSADPNGTPRNNVQNWPGVTYLNDNGNGTHQDHIMLMLASSTESVGFQDSNGSLVHLDCCANAGADVIDAWALAHEDSLKAIGKFGATVTDEWERSFVGLDYEQQTINELYAGYTAKALDFCDGNSQYILYHGQVYAKSDFADFDLKDPGNNAVQYIKDNISSMGLAEYIKYTKTDGTVGKVTKDAYNYKLTQDQYKTLYKVDIPNGEAGLYNLDMILGYIYESALPTQNDGNWVKNIGGRDYVFSDWIVTLTKASKTEKQNDPTPNLRVIAEDLTVEANGDASDFDFNDVVFDVYYTTEKSAAKVKVKAAGGTLPLRIAKKANPTSDADYYEVHDLFAAANPGVNCAGKMINTNGTAETQSQAVRSRSLDNMKEPAAFELDFTVSNAADAKNIIIQVNKGDGTGWVALTAERGKVASKVAVGTSFLWNDERQPMPDSFKQYVTSTETTYDEWWRVNEKQQQ